MGAQLTRPKPLRPFPVWIPESSGLRQLAAQHGGAEGSNKVRNQTDPAGDGRQGSDTPGSHAFPHGPAAQGWSSRAPTVRKCECGAAYVIFSVLPYYCEFIGV